MNARFAAALSFVASCAVTAVSRAADGEDASYGRFDGDLGLVAAAGATLGPRAPRASADIRVRYLSTAGIFATYEDGPLVGSSAEPKRVFSSGIELRPLFLARWATGTEIGVPRIDLLIDSLGLELGAFFAQPAGARFGARPGLQAGIAFELPLLATATGPFVGVHGGVRWSDAALAGGPLDGPSDRALYLTLVLGWQQLVGAHLVGHRRVPLKP